MVRRPCPHAHCAACRAGRQDFCFTGDFTERGIKQAHGFMTESVVDDASYMNVVPKALREVAVLVEPLTIAEKALLQIGQVQERLPWACPVHPTEKAGHCHKAVVLGAGPVGILGAMALVVAGFRTFVYSREAGSDMKATLVRSFGAEYVSAGDCPVDDLAKRLGNIDLVYEATGASQLAFNALNQLGTNGIFVLTGVPGRRGPINIDTDLIMRNLVLRNQVLFGTVNAGKEAFAAAVRDLGVFMARFPAAVRAMITGRHPVNAYRDLLLGPLTGIKNVISLE
jgi:threonine dehydrogenase-like Zn-dependent dehydrogenase